MANSYTYDAFGVARGVSESISNRYRFGTKRLDPGSDLYYFIARQYGATLGRFLGPDPTERGNVTRQYVYVFSRPTTLTDVDGAGALVTFKCTLQSEELVGDCKCTRLCTYKCVRLPGTEGCHSNAAPGPLCDEIPKRMTIWDVGPPHLAHYAG